MADTLPRALPGADLVDHGVRDLLEGRRTVPALLVSRATARLRGCGVDVPDHDVDDPGREMYHLLAVENAAGAHARYNALSRRLVSYMRAAERARRR